MHHLQQDQIDCSQPWLLLQEMTYRVRNEYGLAISALSLAAAKAPNSEAKGAIGAAVNRLLEYAELHQALQWPVGRDHVDLSVHLSKLCRTISRSLLAHRDISLTLFEDFVELDGECCWKIGLIVSELVTNAAKHAFGDGADAGAIRVELLCVDDDIQCTVYDNGKCVAAPRAGRGSEIVAALAKNLGGSVTWKFGNDGTRATLRFTRDQGSPATTARAEKLIHFDPEVDRTSSRITMRPASPRLSF